jgi:VanZ family protein
VRFLQTILLTLLSASVVVGVLLLLSFVSPYVWIPLTYAAALGAWLSLLPFVRDKELGFWIFFGLAIAVLVVWALSEGVLSPTIAGLKFKVSAWEWWTLVAVDIVLLVGLIQSRADRQRVGWLITLVILSVLVVQTSNSGASAGRMVHFFTAYLHLDEATAEHVVVVIRKTIHVCFYGFLAFTAWRAAGQAQLRRGSLLLFAAGAALIVASFDELRQTTQMGRGGSAWDVLLDMVGACAALALSQWWGAKSPARDPAKRAQ